MRPAVPADHLRWGNPGREKRSSSLLVQAKALLLRSIKTGKVFPCSSTGTPCRRLSVYNLQFCLIVFLMILLSSCSHTRKNDGPPNYNVDVSNIPNAVHARTTCQIR